MIARLAAAAVVWHGRSRARPRKRAGAEVVLSRARPLFAAARGEHRVFRHSAARRRKAIDAAAWLTLLAAVRGRDDASAIVSRRARGEARAARAAPARGAPASSPRRSATSSRTTRSTRRTACCGSPSSCCSSSSCAFRARRARTARAFNAAPSSLYGGLARARGAVGVRADVVRRVRRASLWLIAFVALELGYQREAATAPERLRQTAERAARKRFDEAVEVGFAGSEVDARRALAPAPAFELLAQLARAARPLERRAHAHDVTARLRDEHRVRALRVRLREAVAEEAVDAAAPRGVRQHVDRGARRSSRCGSISPAR